jgi:hypothetical protein
MEDLLFISVYKKFEVFETYDIPVIILKRDFLLSGSLYDLLFPIVWWILDLSINEAFVLTLLPGRKIAASLGA